MPNRSRRRAWLKIALCLLPVAALAVLAVNWWMVTRARGRIFHDLGRLPKNDIAIVLGCAPVLSGSRSNLFFEGRMDTAANLYRAGKVRHLLLSGDNGTRAYDEPAAMHAALIRRGVPATALTVDDAGFRTLDTMARAAAVFGVNRATVVTDDFHEARALFLARSFGVDAIGFPTEDVPLNSSFKTRLRELASRFVACLDVYVLKTGPKFYGPREKITLAQE